MRTSKKGYVGADWQSGCKDATKDGLQQVASRQPRMECRVARKQPSMEQVAGYEPASRARRQPDAAVHLIGWNAAAGRPQHELQRNCPEAAVHLIERNAETSRTAVQLTGCSSAPDYSKARNVQARRHGLRRLKGTGCADSKTWSANTDKGRAGTVGADSKARSEHTQWVRR